jgi:hypothetical protein
MIAFAVFGIIALVKGEFYLTRNRVVRAVPARIIGVTPLLPLPLQIVVGAFLGVVFVAKGQQVDVNDPEFQRTANVLGAIIIVGCLLAAILVAVATAKLAKRKRRRRYEEDDDEEYADRPRRRLRTDDEEEELPPRRRPRDEDDEDRPRRRSDDRYRE